MKMYYIKLLHHGRRRLFSKNINWNYPVWWCLCLLILAQLLYSCLFHPTFSIHNYFIRTYVEKAEERVAKIFCWWEREEKNYSSSFSCWEVKSLLGTSKPEIPGFIKCKRKRDVSKEWIQRCSCRWYRASVWYWYELSVMMGVAKVVHRWKWKKHVLLDALWMQGVFIR